MFSGTRSSKGLRGAGGGWGAASAGCGAFCFTEVVGSVVGPAAGEDTGGRGAGDLGAGGFWLVLLMAGSARCTAHAKRPRTAQEHVSRRMLSRAEFISSHNEPSRRMTAANVEMLLNWPTISEKAPSSCANAMADCVTIPNSIWPRR